MYCICCCAIFISAPDAAPVEGVAGCGRASEGQVRPAMSTVAFDAAFARGQHLAEVRARMAVYGGSGRGAMVPSTPANIDPMMSKAMALDQLQKKLKEEEAMQRKEDDEEL